MDTNVLYIMMQRAEADLFVSKILLDIFKQPCAEIDLAAYHLQQALEKLMNYKLIAYPINMRKLMTY